MSGPRTDEQFIRQTLDLARAGIGLASPNPYVGAIIIDHRGEMVGSGTHTYDGVKHAEVLALEQAGTNALGSTVYVNLEPCSHQGRTGPCADALIAAGVSRVVIAMQDPNPQVSGKGIARLRAAGIVVETGLLEQEARLLNEAFAKYIVKRIPLVTLKSAMTLDGKIAPPEHAREWITGEKARAHVQQLRHQHDAILVGVGTIIADDPLLTDRSGAPRRRPLLRVVLDSRLRIPLNSRIVQTANDDVLVFALDTNQQKRGVLQKKGIRVEVVHSEEEGRIDLSAVLRRLGELQITSLLIEGGSSVNRTAIEQQIVDKVFLYYAPKVFGTAGSVPILRDTGLPNIGGISRLERVRLHRFGDDVAIEGYLRDPYRDTAGTR